MTCKDCLHCKVCLCNDNYDHHASSLCDHFKNKADVVKVVRCKDCKHNKYEQPNGFIHCHRDIKEGWIFRRTTDYCSYGERKCE